MQWPHYTSGHWNGNFTFCRLRHQNSKVTSLGLAGLESDIVIADRLFGQIIDMRHDTKKGSVGTLAKHFERVRANREVFTSATLVSIMICPLHVYFCFLFGMWGVIW